MQLDPERMPVQARTFVRCGQIWQAVRGFKSEALEDVDDGGR